MGNKVTGHLSEIGRYGLVFVLQQESPQGSLDESWELGVLLGNTSALWLQVDVLVTLAGVWRRISSSA